MRCSSSAAFLIASASSVCVALPHVGDGLFRRDSSPTGSLSRFSVMTFST
jgi:hypothetical protein